MGNITGCRLSLVLQSRLMPRRTLRDLVWAPAELSLPNQGRVPAFIPSRYPETAKTT
jgi:protein involved in temperature-dependent protein secretion